MAWLRAGSVIPSPAKSRIVLDAESTLARTFARAA
jgi:hypothetical protein